MWLWPQKGGARPRISAMITPHDHRSTDGPYRLLPQSSSGGRYHRVTTYEVKSSASSSWASAIPPRSVGGGVGGGGGREAARDPKVGDAELAVAVDEEVRRHEVAVEDAGGVEGGDAAEELPREVAAVVLAQRLRRLDDLVEVGVHQLRHQVQVAPVAERAAGRAHDAAEAEDVRVRVEPKVLQDRELAQRAPQLQHVLGRPHQLDRDGRAAVAAVLRLAHDAVRALADRLHVDVPRVHRELVLAAAGDRRREGLRRRVDRRAHEAALRAQLRERRVLAAAGAAAARRAQQLVEVGEAVVHLQEGVDRDPAVLVARRRLQEVLDVPRVQVVVLGADRDEQVVVLGVVERAVAVVVVRREARARLALALVVLRRRLRRRVVLRHRHAQVDRPPHREDRAAERERAPRLLGAGSSGGEGAGAAAAAEAAAAAAARMRSELRRFGGGGGMADDAAASDMERRIDETEQQARQEATDASARLSRLAVEIFCACGRNCLRPSPTHKRRRARKPGRLHRRTAPSTHDAEAQLRREFRHAGRPPHPALAHRSGLAQCRPTTPR